MDALFVQLLKGALWVVLRLERAICSAAIVALEFLRREETVRIERFDAAELDHLALDQAIEVPRGVRLARALHVPETEIDGPLVSHRIQRKLPTLRPDRADPLRPERDVLGVESQKLRRARERNVDVLDHRLGMHAHDALDFFRDADAA